MEMEPMMKTTGITDTKATGITGAEAADIAKTEDVIDVLLNRVLLEWDDRVVDPNKPIMATPFQLRSPALIPPRAVH
jgi:hypothetical protein